MAVSAGTVRVKLPTAYAVLLGFVAVLAVLASLFVWVGIPALIGVLVFPALGFAPPAVVGLSVVVAVVWWVLLSLLTRKK